MRALENLGEGAQRSSDIAEALGKHHPVLRQPDLV